MLWLSRVVYDNMHCSVALSWLPHMLDIDRDDSHW